MVLLFGLTLGLIAVATWANFEDAAAKAAALLIFLTAAMENPYRGEFSVSPDAYKTVLDRVLAPRK